MHLSHSSGSHGSSLMDSSLSALHQRAQELATTLKHCEYELVEIFQKLDASKGFRALGFASLYEYATRGLGLSEGTAYNLITVARKAAQVPALKSAIRSGDLTVSNAGVDPN